MVKKYLLLGNLCILQAFLCACGGTKSSGGFGQSSYSSSSYAGSSLSLRITNDGSSLVKQSDKQVQIGGVCNQGDNLINEIRMTVKRNSDPNCASAMTESSYPIVNKGICESGRFYIVFPLVAMKTAFPCTANANVQYTFGVQIYSGANSLSLSAGPKYSADITIQH